MSKGLMQNVIAGGAILLLSATVATAQDYTGQGERETEIQENDESSAGRINRAPKPPRIVRRVNQGDEAPQVTRAPRISNALVWSTGAYR